MRIVGCFVFYQDRFVILHRLAHKPDGNTWGLPAGKVESDEDDITAVLREISEETGYAALPKDLEKLLEYQMIRSNGDKYVFVAYKLVLDEPHDIQLETSAHDAYAWVTPTECDAYSDLIHGLHRLLRKANFLA